MKFFCPPWSCQLGSNSPCACNSYFWSLAYSKRERHSRAYCRRESMRKRNRESDRDKRHEVYATLAEVWGFSASCTLRPVSRVLLDRPQIPNNKILPRTRSFIIRARLEKKKNKCFSFYCDLLHRKWQCEFALNFVSDLLECFFFSRMSTRDPRIFVSEEFGFCRSRIERKKNEFQQLFIFNCMKHRSSPPKQQSRSESSSREPAKPIPMISHKTP